MKQLFKSALSNYMARKTKSKRCLRTDDGNWLPREPNSAPETHELAPAASTPQADRVLHAEEQDQHDFLRRGQGFKTKMLERKRKGLDLKDADI